MCDWRQVVTEEQQRGLSGTAARDGGDGEEGRMRRKVDGRETGGPS